MITVLLRHQHSPADLFRTLLHELAHVRQYQLASKLNHKTVHRVESWRLAAYEATQKLWPDLFAECEFIGTSGKRAERKRLSDRTLHHFPDALQPRIEEAGLAYIPKGLLS